MRDVVYPPQRAGANWEISFCSGESSWSGPTPRDWELLAELQTSQHLVLANGPVPGVWCVAGYVLVLVLAPNRGGLLTKDQRKDQDQSTKQGYGWHWPAAASCQLRDHTGQKAKTKTRHALACFSCFKPRSQ